MAIGTREGGRRGVGGVPCGHYGVGCGPALPVPVSVPANVPANAPAPTSAVGFREWLASQLRDRFIDYLGRNFVAGYLRERLMSDAGYRQLLDELARKAGYSGLAGLVGANLENVDTLARLMLYVLLDKIMFYKVLERYYPELPRLEPLAHRVKSSREYLDALNKYFEAAMRVTGDFESVFRTGLFDELVLPDDPEVWRTIDQAIELLSSVEVEKLSDVVGHVYEELIPPEERHQLGEFYTPPPIAEFITRWAIRSPSDVVIDPGAGGGEFLVEAYKRLFELKTGMRYGEAVPSSEVHREILRQVYGIDINPFAVQLVALNLAMRSPMSPGTDVNMYNADFFSVRPEQLPKFDAVIGNPPYTRWVEIPRETREAILRAVGEEMRKYDLVPQAHKNTDVNMSVYWIMHATKFLKEGGRLGLIIPDLWLQTAYGINFGNYLLDHYRVRAIIDFARPLFPSALVTTNIILAEKESDPRRRDENEVVFVYVPDDLENIDFDEVLRAVETKRSSRYYVKVVRQGDMPRDRRWIDVFFGNERARDIYSNPLFTRLGDLFEVAAGNTKWAFWAAQRKKWQNPGSTEFFYLSPNRLRALGLDKYAYPNTDLRDALAWPALIRASDARYFTFTREDWESMCRGDKDCYMLIAHVPREAMPPELARYVGMGEAEIRTGIRKSRGGGRPASEALSSKTREAAKDVFYGWYDLAGVEETPIIAIREGWRMTRFAKLDFPAALSDAFFAFKPKTGLDEDQLKALLAYLNSSFMQYYLETHSRKSGGGALSLDPGVLLQAPILDVRRLPRDKVEELARLFDKLESEARRVGGAVREDQVRAIKPVIREIDEAVAGVLGVGADVVDEVERAAGMLAERRIAGNKRSKSAQPVVTQSIAD